MCYLTESPEWIQYGERVVQPAVARREESKVAVAATHTVWAGWIQRNDLLATERSIKKEWLLCLSRCRAHGNGLNRYDIYYKPLILY